MIKLCKKLLNRFSNGDSTIRLNNRTIRSAVSEWLKNPKEAEFVYGHISNWDTSKVTSMKWLFFNAPLFDEFIGDWDVSNVTDINGMFKDSKFNGDISNWVKKPTSYKQKSYKPKKPDCTPRDNNFIYTKMEQLNYDVVGIQSTGYRVYLVTYIKRRDMLSGYLLLDYSNSPCY